MCILYLLLNIFLLGGGFCETSKPKNESTKTNIDYCTHPDCPLKNQHTMCIAANKQSPRLFASGMTTWMRYQILLLHNRHRDNIAMGFEAGQPPATNMRKMYWDYELEKMADVWARQCQKRHDECRNTIRFNVLQNMDVRPVAPRVTEAQLLADAVGAWFSGSRALLPENVWSFRLSNCSALGGCNSHWYSAAAWASTWRIGCSQALCTAKKRSCIPFRKRRRTREMAGEMNANTSSTTENVLRRIKYTTPTKVVRFEDFATTLTKFDKESPLHRGLVMGSNEIKRKEAKMIAFTFCNYGPAGNINGFPIYEAGSSCTNCPQGTQCGDHTHRALCSVVGDPDARNPK
ncbi:venom allergen 3-like [Epargyreus clarus]|uniref:venom allergen 3-like n=1 Tax=Epargyreus clarus TaxID=520877 RepID=UPI003C2C963E